MSKKYRDYFQIDESYFPAINEDVIRTQPDVWKKYYPHESFVKLLNQTKSVLTNGQHMSIWVEGAYGTGKSHAVLTLKKILDCSNEELEEYFNKYSTILSKDLYNEFLSIKNQQKKVLTVHRMGSSEIKNDAILMLCIQESIITALKEKGYSYLGQVGLKQAMINWLSDDDNKNYFSSIIRSEEYRTLFNGEDANIVLDNLKTYTSEQAIQTLVDKISRVGDDRGINPFVLRKDELKTWIRDVIEKNDLKAIFFIWDEFSDYFEINKGNLSGFQYIVEISESYPFYFAIVTHKSDIFFENANADVKRKINDRFIAPHCSIELPDNMAFLLTAHAMQKVNDPTISKEWEQIVDCLYKDTHNSRDEVIKAAKINEKELKGVLPIHPYAALLLKHIATAFDSNQRSMFDFIKNDRGDEIKSFQWFINNYGPDDQETLLTVDMLWDFFYEKGRDQLAPQFRAILDVFGRTESHNLEESEKRVLKTILLLQAINEKVSGSVDLFIPNEKNLCLAFEGTDITLSNVKAIAQRLIDKQIIFERSIAEGKTKYSALIFNGNREEVEREKDRLRKEISTDKLIEEGEFESDFKLPKYLEIRFFGRKCVSYETFQRTITQIKNDSENHHTRLYAVYTFARNEEESNKIRDLIKRAYDDGFDKIVFIDFSTAYLNNDLFEQYIENMANCIYQRGKDNGQADSYNKNAKDALKRWKNQIRVSTPKLFTPSDKSGTVYYNESDVFNAIKEFDKEKFELSLETHVNVIDNMYNSNALKQGAECGITGEIKGTFKSLNENTKLEKQFEGVWSVNRYWEVKPNELLSKVKNAVEDVIKKKTDSYTRVSISDIYNVLIEPPFGFLPCNLTAFVLGFVLREYANESYNWTDDVTTNPMSIEKLKEMIDEVLKQQQTPNPKFRDKYIVAMSPEQRAFNAQTSYVFGIDEQKCSSIENTRTYIREKMGRLEFPIWTLKLLKFNINNKKETLDKLIDLYVDLANNSASQKTETVIAIEIGKLYIQNEHLQDDLKSILTNENCTNGILEYLKVYKDGCLLSLAKDIGDTGGFIREINKKFSESSNWVWNKDTINEKIDETITEYEIIKESNSLIIKTSTFDDCLKEWGKKAQTFKVNYNGIRSEVGELQRLLGFLYQIARDGYINDTNKKDFLKELKDHNSQFKEFCENQITLLKKVRWTSLCDLSDKDVREIVSQPYLTNVFTCENGEFQNKLELAISEYKANSLKRQLVDIWKKKTDTDSPEAWSDTYSMPIICMIPFLEQEKAREVFSIINSQINDENKVKDAIEYVSKFSHFDNLKDSRVRDRCFRRAILRNYSSLFDNTDDIKNKIRNYSPISPYNWLGNEAIYDFVSKEAQQLYEHGASEKVNDILDSMKPEELRDYMKKLIAKNINVGVEILKNKGNGEYR